MEYISKPGIYYRRLIFKNNHVLYDINTGQTLKLRSIN